MKICLDIFHIETNTESVYAVHVFSTHLLQNNLQKRDTEYKVCTFYHQYVFHTVIEHNGAHALFYGDKIYNQWFVLTNSACKNDLSDLFDYVNAQQCHIPHTL